MVVSKIRFLRKLLTTSNIELLRNMSETGRIKVLFLITKGIPGGAQRYVFDLATHLPVNEYNSVVAFGEGGELGEELSRQGFRTISIPDLKRDINLLKEFKVLFALIKLFREEKPDVVHLNSSKIGGLGALAGRITRVPKIVFTAHGWTFNEDRNMVSKKIIKFLHWLTAILSHKMIAVSQKTADDISSLPFLEGKIEVVHNGIGELSFEPKAKVRTLLAPQIHEGVWIGTISELHKNKGIDFALEAFARLVPKYAHIAFVVIGGAGTAEGKGEEEKLIELTKTLGISDKVHFMGNIPDASLLMKAFDIFTLTSRTEALPYVLLEAGRAELAVVASSVGGIPEIIKDKKSGLLVEAKNVEEITEALEYLIEKPNVRTKLGKELARTVSRKFGVDRMVEETEKMYRL